MTTIGMILDKPFPPDPRVNREAVALVEAGYKVHLLAITYQGETTLENLDGIFVHRTNIGFQFWKKMRALALFLPYYFQYWERRISSFVQENGIEVLHAHDLPLYQPAKIVADQYGIPLVMDMHENFACALKMYPWAISFWGKKLINLAAWEKHQADCILRSDRIIVTAEESVEYFHDLYDRDAESIVAIENVLDHVQFLGFPIENDIYQRLKDKFYQNIVIGYTGAFLPNRGVQHFIKILPGLVNIIPEVRLVLIGDGRYRRDLEKLADDLYIKEYVIFFEKQPYHLLPTYLSIFDIGITRLERNLQNDYTTPNKVFEYMAMGIPVLTSDSLPMRRIVGSTRTGLIFEAGNVSQLKSVSLSLLQDKTLRKELGDNGRSLIRDRYNWNISKGQLIGLYDGLFR